MSKYKVIYYWSDGSSDAEDEIFDSYDEALDAANYGLQCRRDGAEILNMSNPGDYPYDEDDFEDDSFEIEEIDA